MTSPSTVRSGNPSCSLEERHYLAMQQRGAAAAGGAGAAGGGVGLRQLRRSLSEGAWASQDDAGGLPSWTLMLEKMSVGASSPDSGAAAGSSGAGSECGAAGAHPGALGDDQVVSHLLEQAQAQETQIQALCAELEGLRRVREQLEVHRRREEGLQVQVRDLIEQVDVLEREQEAFAEVGANAGELRLLREREELLRRHVHELTLQVETLEAEREERVAQVAVRERALQRQLDGLVARLAQEQLRSEAQEGHAERETGLRERLSELLQQLAGAEAERQALEAERQALAEENETLAAQREALEDGKEALLQEIQLLRAREQTLERQVAELGAQLGQEGRAMEELSLVRERESALLRRVHDLTAAAQAAKHKETQGVCAIRNREVELEQEVEALAEELAGLRIQAAQARGLQVEVLELRDHVEELQAHSQRLRLGQELLQWAVAQLAGREGLRRVRFLFTEGESLALTSLCQTSNEGFAQDESLDVATDGARKGSRRSRASRGSRSASFADASAQAVAEETLRAWGEVFSNLGQAPLPATPKPLGYDYGNGEGSGTPSGTPSAAATAFAAVLMSVNGTPRASIPASPFVEPMAPSDLSLAPAHRLSLGAPSPSSSATTAVLVRGSGGRARAQHRKSSSSTTMHLNSTSSSSESSAEGGCTTDHSGGLVHSFSDEGELHAAPQEPGAPIARKESEPTAVLGLSDLQNVSQGLRRLMEQLWRDCKPLGLDLAASSATGGLQDKGTREDSWLGVTEEGERGRYRKGSYMLARFTAELWSPEREGCAAGYTGFREEWSAEGVPAVARGLVSLVVQEWGEAEVVVAEVEGVMDQMAALEKRGEELSHSVQLKKQRLASLRANVLHVLCRSHDPSLMPTADV